MRFLPVDSYAPQASYLPAANQPPRAPIELVAQQSDSRTPGEAAVRSINLDPNEMVIGGESNVDEITRPGVSEWTLTRSDGSTQIVPVASVIRVGEGDLTRAESGSIAQQLLPLEIKFVSSGTWSAENQTAGSSTMTLLLLGLLGVVLAGEQMLAYWASYHVTPSRAVDMARTVGGHR
jgi:hypothetical protein